MRPERVLILTPGFHGFDGISAVAREAARALRDPRWELEVWSLVDGEVPHGRGAAGRRDRLLTWSLAEAARPTTLARLLVVSLHVHLAVAALPLRVRGARTALFLHGIEAWGALSLLRRVALASAAPLLANSAYTAGRVTARHPAWVRAPIVACPLGLPLEGPAPGPASLEPGFVLSVGRLSAAERYKGTDALLECWPQVVAHAPSARLVIVGEGDDRARLEEKARAGPCAARIRFMGRLEAAALERLYRDCALFALPSTGEGFGLVFLEAMRAGRAVLAAHGGADEVVEQGVTGRIVDPSDRRALAAEIGRLLADDALRAALGLAGRARFAARFTSASFEARLRRGLDLPGPSSAPC